MPPIPPPEPPLLRFRLRQMFFFVTVFCVLMALFVLTKGPWPLAIGATSVLVAAHVFATLVGNRLRDASQGEVQWRAANPTLMEKLPKSEAKPFVLPPTTILAGTSFVNNWLKGSLVGGALLGTVLGGTILRLMIGPRIGWAGWAVGVISCGVLGTWAAFLASSFGSIAWQAWQDAHEKKR